MNAHRAAQSKKPRSFFGERELYSAKRPIWSCRPSTL